MTGRTLERSRGSWSKQENRKLCATGLKCSEKQIKAHICHLPCLPALSCLDLKVIGSQGGDSWRKLHTEESIYLQWDAAMLVQDAVSRRMCSPHFYTHVHTHAHTSHLSHLHPQTRIQVWSRMGSWLLEGLSAAGSQYCVRGWVWVQPAETSLSLPSCVL